MVANEVVTGDVVRWTAWLLGTAVAPKVTDRFVITGGPTIQVNKAEDLTDLDGVLDHWELDCKEIKRSG